MVDNPAESKGLTSALLQFAVAVLVLGVIGAFALERIAQLQVSADRVAEQTRAAQSASLTALEGAGRAVPASAACVPVPPQAASRSPASTVSCP